MSYNRLQVGIKPKNLEKSFAFYKDALQLPYLGALPTSGIVLHRFEAGGATLKLLESPAVELDNPPGSPGDANGLRWLTLEVNDLQTLLARLEQKDVLPKFPLTTDDNGVSFVILEDPDGIWVELVEVP